MIKSISPAPYNLVHVRVSAYRREGELQYFTWVRPVLGIALTEEPHGNGFVNGVDYLVMEPKSNLPTLYRELKGDRGSGTTDGLSLDNHVDSRIESMKNIAAKKLVEKEGLSEHVRLRETCSEA
jgi:hypothetical protein